MARPNEPNRPYLQAYIQWCDDEVCDCYQPIISLVQDNPVSPSLRLCTRLWAGTFHSQPEAGERLEQIAELVWAASRFYIRLDPKSWSGERAIPNATAIEYLERLRRGEDPAPRPVHV